MNIDTQELAYKVSGFIKKIENELFWSNID